MKPVLNAPGTKRSILKYDDVLPSFAFSFNLRRFSMAVLLSSLFCYNQTGAYTRSLFSST
jgi:hypothetical protein